MYIVRRLPAGHQQAYGVLPAHSGNNGQLKDGVPLKPLGHFARQILLPLGGFDLNTVAAVADAAQLRGSPGNYFIGPGHVAAMAQVRALLFGHQPSLRLDVPPEDKAGRGQLRFIRQKRQQLFGGPLMVQL